MPLFNATTPQMISYACMPRHNCCASLPIAVSTSPVSSLIMISVAFIFSLDDKSSDVICVTLEDVMTKLKYATVFAEREKGIPAKDLARKYKVPIQNIYNAISRAKAAQRRVERAARTAPKTVQSTRRRYPRPSPTLVSLVYDEIASLRRKRDQIIEAIEKLEEIGQ